jgi:radical SAM protein with 4Fe4S-binding SPASM domain
MNKDIYRMIKYAKDRGIYTVISTNGQRLDQENAGRILESGLDRIILSVDGTEQSTYEKYRAGGDLGRVLEGTKSLNLLRKERNTLRPEIIYQFLLFRHNESKVKSFREFGKKAGADRTWIKTAQIINRDRLTDVNPADSNYSRYRHHDGNGLIVKARLKNRCTRLWRTCVITSDGDVVPCCFDKEAKYKMGSLKDATLSEIWKNEKYARFRKKVLSGRKEIDICNNCSEGLRVYIR